MNKRYLLWTALVIAAVIAIRPMFWLGIIGFAWLMVVLAVFVGLVAAYLLSLKKGSLYREIGFGVLIIAIVCAVIALKFSAPELSAGEVKALFSHPPYIESYSSGTKAVSAEYRGGGIWKVKVVTLHVIGGGKYRYEGSTEVHEFPKHVVKGNASYLYYDENTKQIRNK